MADATESKLPPRLLDKQVGMNGNREDQHAAVALVTGPLAQTSEKIRDEQDLAQEELVASVFYEAQGRGYGNPNDRVLKIMVKVASAIQGTLGNVADFVTPNRKPEEIIRDINSFQHRIGRFGGVFNDKESWKKREAWRQKKVALELESHAEIGSADEALREHKVDVSKYDDKENVELGISTILAGLSGRINGARVGIAARLSDIAKFFGDISEVANKHSQDFIAIKGAFLEDSQGSMDSHREAAHQHGNESEVAEKEYKNLLNRMGEHRGSVLAAYQGTKTGGDNS